MYKQASLRKKKLKKLYDETKYSYGAGCFFDDNKNRLVKYSLSKRAGSRKSFVKKCCNKKFRRNSLLLETTHKGYYHKASEYWWEIF